MDVNGRDESGTETEQSPKAPTVGTEDLTPQLKNCICPLNRIRIAQFISLLIPSALYSSSLTLEEHLFPFAHKISAQEALETFLYALNVFLI